MAYTKTLWEARQGVNLNRFSKSQETGSSVLLTNEPDSITRQGTPFSPDNMNHIEDGIEQAHNLLADESLARERGEQGLRESIASETRARQQADQAIRQSITEGGQDIRAVLEEVTISMIVAGLYTVYVRPNSDLVLRTPTSGNYFRLRVNPNGDLVVQATEGRPNYFRLDPDTGNLIFSI